MLPDTWLDVEMDIHSFLVSEARRYGHDDADTERVLAAFPAVSTVMCYGS